MDVSIIIVNYNTKEITRNCLQSIFDKTKDIDYEVIVSDNGSEDGSVEMIKKEFPQVILIENNENLGFGAANNRAIHIAKGKYVFFLNSDTLLVNNAVKIFFDYWENSKNKNEIGAIGGWLKDEHGNCIHSGGKFPDYKQIVKHQIWFLLLHIYKGFFKFNHIKRYSRSKNNSQKNSLFFGKEMLVDYVTGADLFMKNNNDSLFDEEYFLYYEETDMQLKLSKKGLKRILISGPEIYHLEKKHVSGNIVTFSDLHSQRSALIFSKRYLNGKSCILRFLTWLDWKNYYVAKEIKALEFHKE